MKPTEIVGEHKVWHWLGYRADYEILQKYRDDDCVVGSYTSPLGTVFMLKGSRKFFAFLYYPENCLVGRNARRLTRLMGEDFVDTEFMVAYKLISTKGKVHDKKLWRQLCNELALKHI